MTEGILKRFRLSDLLRGSAHKREQSNLPGLFDGQRQFALMFGTGAGDPSGNDFSPFRDELFQGLGVFVINYHVVVHAEPANFATLVESVFGATSLGLVSIHNLSPPILNSILIVCDGFSGRF
jgi:hypothetical protein